MAYGILVPWPGIKLRPLHWKVDSFCFFFFNIYLFIWLWWVLEHVGSSPMARDRTRAPRIASTVLATGPPQKSLEGRFLTTGPPGESPDNNPYLALYQFASRLKWTSREWIFHLINIYWVPTMYQICIRHRHNIFIISPCTDQFMSMKKVKYRVVEERCQNSSSDIPPWLLTACCTPAMYKVLSKASYPLLLILGDEEFWFYWCRTKA